MGKKKKKIIQTYFNTALAAVTAGAVVDTGQKNASLLTDLKHCGVILQKHSVIKDLYVLSGANAKNNEFQMHYWMLVFRHTFEDGGFFDIAVPTCYFNYEQFVTAAHVDFEMKDVSELSAKIEPIHNMITNQILATDFKASLETLFGVQFEALSVDVGTLHRHPGSSYSQRFSGTDLDANKTHHGIVFPLKSGVDKPSFSGILAIDGGECNVAHYEYRVVNGSYDTNDMTYVKGRCLAITNNDTFVPPTLSSIQKFFGVQPATPSIKIKEDNNIIPAQTIAALDSLISMLPTPNTQLVRSENVKVKVHTYTASTYWGGGWNKPSELTKPYQLNYKAYDYPLQVLRNSLERHYDYTKVPYKTHEIYKLTKVELEEALEAVYKLENEKAAAELKKAEKAKATKAKAPLGSFIICDIPIHTEAELEAMTREQLLVHRNALDEHYYGNRSEPESADSDITKVELIEEITELYINIYDEEQELMGNATGYNRAAGVVTHSAKPDDGDTDGLRDYYDYYS